MNNHKDYQLKQFAFIHGCKTYIHNGKACLMGRSKELRDAFTLFMTY